MAQTHREKQSVILCIWAGKKLFPRCLPLVQLSALSSSFLAGRAEVPREKSWLCRTSAFLTITAEQKPHPQTVLYGIFLQRTLTSPHSAALVSHYYLKCQETSTDTRVLSIFNHNIIQGLLYPYCYLANEWSTKFANTLSHRLSPSPCKQSKLEL